MVTNSAAQVVDTYTYSAFGIPVGSTGTDPNPFRFGGQVGYYTGTNQAAYMNLIRCGARWYDPEIGRWVSRDPIGYAGGANLFEYCANNPVNFVDPSGQDWGYIKGFLHSGLKQLVDMNDSSPFFGPIRLAGINGPTRSIASHFISLDEQSGEYFGYRDAHDFLGIAFVAAGQVGGSVRVPRSCAVETDAAKIARLTAEAELRYPKLAGKINNHHEDPMYMGGDPLGLLSRINAAYHQLITNAFRRQHPYGSGTIDAARRAEIMKKVYGDYPLPPRI